MACSCTPARLEHWWISNWESWKHGARGGWRLLEVGGWRHGARGGCTGHAAIFPRWTRGERARPLAWNLREVTQWTKIQPPAAASSPPAAAAPGRRACSEGSSTPQPRRGDLHSARFGFGFPIALPAAGSWQGKEAMPTGWPRAGDAIQRAAAPAPCSWAELRFEAASPRETEPKLPACARFCAISRWWHRSKHCG